MPPRPAADATLTQGGVGEGVVFACPCPITAQLTLAWWPIAAPHVDVLMHVSQLPSTKQAGARVLEHSAAGVDSGSWNTLCKSVRAILPAHGVCVHAAAAAYCHGAQGLPHRESVRGQGPGRIVLKTALEEFAKNGATVEALEKKQRRHAQEYARTIPLAGFDALCAIGGALSTRLSTGCSLGRTGSEFLSALSRAARATRQW